MQKLINNRFQFVKTKPKKEKQHFHTVAIKTTSYGMLPKEGARLTYEVIHLKGTAQHVMLPLAKS